MASDHYVHLGDDTTWPVNVGRIEWVLRYGEPTRSDLLIAASVLHAYAVMTDPTLTMGTAEVNLHRARQAQRQAPIPQEADDER